MNNELIMDDQLKRELDKDLLQKVISKLGDDFIKELPASPEELLKYVKRRTNPVISKNINYELGIRMLNSRMTDEEFLVAYLQSVYVTFNGINTSQDPVAHVLIAQTGAGKTNLRRSVFNSNSNTCLINPDNYKQYNPHIGEFIIKDPTHVRSINWN